MRNNDERVMCQPLQQTKQNITYVVYKQYQNKFKLFIQAISQQEICYILCSKR